MYRLLARSNINDTKTPHAEADVFIAIETFVIGPTIDYGNCHFL